MSQSSFLRNHLGVFFTLLMCISIPLIADTTSTELPQRTNTISRQLLQDRSVQALKQIDVCESIIETFFHSFVSGAIKLPKKREDEIKINLQLLRKDMGIIKDAYAIHIDEYQLIGLINLTHETIRVLTAAVNSGLEVIPAFNEKVLETKKSESITLNDIDTLLMRNEEQLKKLTVLSEQVGLTQLNKMYRSARKMYQKYYIWPLLEHTLVYTAFIHWAVFVTPTYTMKEMQKSPEDSWKYWLGKCGEDFHNRVGKKPFQKTQNRQQEKYGLVVPNPENPFDYAPAPSLRVDNTSVLVNGQWIENEDHIKATIKTLHPEADLNSDATKKIIEGVIATINKNKLTKVAKAPLVHTIDDTYTASAASGGMIDWAQGVIDMDWTTALIQVPIGKIFYNYMAKDYEIISEQSKKIASKIDDILFGTTKKRSYESLTMPDERFENIVGREEVKAELNKVVEYICSPDKFDRAGIKVERGYLLAGDPQTGKTFMAKALTGEINDALAKMGRNDKVRLFEIGTDALINKGIAYYMDLARYHAPCILFLDELDLLRLQRDGDSKLLSEFLTSMSGTLSKDEKSHVIILAATNKPENLDFALRQHGRFGKMFWFDKPTFNHRIEFFKKECEKRCMNIERFDFEELAKQTEGCSFGSLDIVMKKALMLAKFDGTSVTQTHFEQAMDAEVKKMIPHGYDIPAEKEQIIAVHQAGKALMSMLLEPQKQLSKVTILPITQDLQEEHVTQQYNIAGLQSKDQRAIRYGGIFSYNWSDSLNIESQDELKKQCKILLAGNIAQTVFNLPSPAYDKIDKQDAFKLAKQIVFEGLDPKEVAKTIREEKLTQAYRLIEQYEREIAADLKEHQAWLTATTKALQERKTLSVGELKELQSKA